MKKDLIKFLNNIANNVGEVITEYHWREACELIRSIENEHWVHIKSKNDLPNYNGEFWALTKNKSMVILSKDALTQAYVTKQVTHYQLIDKPKISINFNNGGY